MKRSIIFNSVLLGLVLAVGAVGCRHKTAPGVVILPGQKGQPPKDDGNSNLPPAVPPGRPGGDAVPPVEGTPLPPGGLSGIDLIKDMIPDAARLKAKTAYFDYDRHVVRSSERGKIEEVAVYLKGAPDHKLMIDGHCDERGTEEYNRALGEQRALALREYLIKLGISGDRLYTRTYGEDRPAVEGHDEAAWSKNRRGEFIDLRPKPVAN